MQSTIRIDFADLGIGRGLEPIIRVKAITTEDPRDQLIKTLFQGSVDYLQVEFTECTHKTNKETGLAEMDKIIILHKSKKELQPEFNNVYGNSIGFRNFLDKEKIKYKPNEHYTLIDASVDLFELGQKFEKYHMAETGVKS